jgi:hypothetical protein
VQRLRERVASIERWERRAAAAMESTPTKTGRLNELSTVLAFASKRCNLPSSHPTVRVLTRAIAAGERWQANLTRAFARRARKGDAALSAAEKRRAFAKGECSFMYRYILRESCSQFDSLPLTSLTNCRPFECEVASRDAAAARGA